MRTNTENIAVISMGCRFPGARNIPEFLKLLENGKNAVKQFPSTRWNSNGKSKWAGIIDDIYHFDSQFFNLNDVEAKSIDPQHRIYYEAVWQALENAYLKKETLSGEKVGVFTGISTTDYALNLNIKENLSPYSCIGNSGSIASNRLSYFMNWKGPSLAVDTACSSSLVAIHMACQSLRLKECDLAIAGGTNAILKSEITEVFEMAGMLSPDGQCKTFDADANGYVRGEGAGAVILKRLSEAIEDGDPILAVIKGSAINQDGTTNGLTAPNVQSQEEVIIAACKNAGITPNQLEYIELHGTGTFLGDPVEAKALANIITKEVQEKNKCAVSSVKTNIGHLEAAAGIAAFIKAVLSINSKQLFPSLNYSNPNPHIPFDSLPFYVQTSLQKWESNYQYTGISGFGFGGTNSHIILSKNPVFNKQENQSSSYNLLNLSAKSEEALEELKNNYKELLRDKTPKEVKLICNLSNQGRSNFPYRLSTHGLNTNDFLKNFQNETKAFHAGKAIRSNKIKTVFLFTGQGSQYFGMAKQLYRSNVVFRQTIEKCDQILQPYLDISLLDILFNKNHQEKVNLTIYAQPAIVSIQLGLIAVLKSHEVIPDVLTGHSLGELTAAYVAGVFSKEDLLKIVSIRAKLMHSVEGKGGMISVSTSETDINLLIKPFEKIEIAAINGPKSIVLTGNIDELKKLEKKLEKKEIIFDRLTVSTAFHSYFMDVILEEFSKCLVSIKTYPLQTKFLSTTTGKLMIEGQRIHPNHWIENIRKPVLFHACIKQFKRLKISHAIELGPKPVLLNLAQLVKENSKIVFLPTLHKRFDDRLFFYDTISKLFQQGYSIEWNTAKSLRNQNIELPNYPFQRREFKFQNKVKETTKTTIETKNIELIKQDMKVSSNSSSTKELVLGSVTKIIAKLLMMEPSKVSIDDSFIEMGADSILLVAAIRQVEAEFKVKLQARQFFGDLNTIENLVDYLVEHSSFVKEMFQKEATQKVIEPLKNNHKSIVNGEVQDIIHRQLDLMQQQLDLLKNKGNTQQETKNKKSSFKSQIKETTYEKKINNILPSWGVQQKSGTKLSKKQQEYLENFTKEYVAQTQESKLYTKRNRKHLADNRASAGFRFSTKNMLYPIVSNKASGSYLWDLDGNKYIDISMGFGVHLFGHNPSFVNKAIIEQLDTFIGLGPQSSLSGEVANLICEITGNDRAMFCNSGTEAVMTALRLARTYRGVGKVVMFKNSYHGHFDGTLGEPSVLNIYETEPMAPGTTEGMIEDLIVLDYGSDEALEFIAENADEIAGVIVEPVQSRKPWLQPKSFLQNLRSITKEKEVILIFDEMITGFRIQKGGAQEWFGIQADIATYGKIVGGGLPIGVVAGKSKYLDVVDGGKWNYEDQSFPEADTTFFAGTFCKHPLTLAASRVTLMKIKEMKTDIYEELNIKTQALVNRLNIFFEEVEAPFKVNCYGSLFRFEFHGNQDLFFFHLLKEGLYIWEGRNCFLSTAHSDEDIDEIFNAIVRSIKSLGDSEYLTLKSNAPQTIETNEAQQQLWRLSQLSEAGNIAYNIPTLINIKGKLDINVFIKSLQIVINRHESLRSYFSEDGKHQIILAKTSANLCIHELSSNDILEHLTEFEVNKSFSLEKGPLFSTTLFKKENGYQFLFVIHHIIADGISSQLFLNELFTLYQEKGSIENTVKPTRLSFWGNWQKEIKTSDIWNNEKEFWSKQIQNTTELVLPFDKARPFHKSYKGEQCNTMFDKNIIHKINVFSKANSVTPFMVLLANFGVLLHKITSNSNFLVGVPSSGRNFENDENLIAYCTHLLPIQFNFNSKINSFYTVLEGVKNNILNAFDHPNFPFSDILKIHQELDNKNTSLVNVTFNLDKVTEVFDIPELELSIAEIPVKISKFDLSINITEFKNELSVSLNYDSDLFSEQTILPLIGQFEKLLINAIENPDEDIANLEIYESKLKEDVHKMLFENEIVFDGPKTIIESFTAQVKLNPNDLAVRNGNNILTYAELDNLSSNLAVELKRKTKGENPTIGLLLPRSLEMVIGILATLKVKGCFVPLEKLPDSRVLEVLEIADCDLVIATNHLITDTLKEKYKGDIISNTYKKANNCKEVDFVLPKVSIEDAAYILFTSGSTGIPKGVEVSNKALQNYTKAAIKAMDLPSKASYGLISSFAADLGYTMVFPSLMLGGCLHVFDDELMLDAYKLQIYIEEFPIDCLKIVPSHLKALLTIKSPEKSLPKQRLILGGESCDVGFAEKIKKWNPDCRIFNHYGPTESTIGILVGEYKETETSGSLLLDNVLANNRVYVLDEKLQQVGIGEKGLLYVGGENLSNGYINQEKQTKELFIQNPFTKNENEILYCTGDLVRITNLGKIQWIGRKDEQVKVRGYRIELSEIEIKLEEHPAISQAMVLVSKSTLIAYLVTKSIISTEELIQYFEEKLPKHMVPSIWMFLDQMPVKPNGKLDRKKLPNPVSKESIIESEKTVLEAKILEIWKSVLNIDTLYIHDHYFELGGDSIQSIQIASRMKEAGLTCKASDLYKNPTVHKLAKKTTVSQFQIPEATIHGEISLLPVQHRFFENFDTHPDHWNMSVLLNMNKDISPIVAEKAIKNILKHHDMLRGAFKKTNNVWKQTVETSRYTFTQKNLNTSSKEREEIQLEEQRKVTLNKTPIRCVWFHRKGMNPQLFITIHHLLIDAISWKLVLSDLNTLIAQLMSNEALQLPQKTASYLDCGIRLQEEVNKNKFESELEYWKTMSEIPIPKCSLPIKSTKEVTVATEKIHLTELTEKQTEILLEQCSSNTNYQIQSVLLTALTKAVSENQKDELLYLELEGHGRDSFLDNIDTTRTIGWFTTHYPVFLMIQEEKFLDAVVDIEKQLSYAQSKGMSYGMLKYLTNETIETQRPEITFNYLGQLDTSLPKDAHFSVAQIKSNNERSLKSNLLYKLGIEVVINKGILQIEWKYSTKQHAEDDIKNLAEKFNKYLLDFLTLEKEIKPDFSNIEIDNDDFKEVLNLLKD